MRVKEISTSRIHLPCDASCTILRFDSHPSLFDLCLALLEIFLFVLRFALRDIFDELPT
jgi:hypothetical protein